MSVAACPFCGGQGVPYRVLRDGYADAKGDPDAYAYFVRCRACAAEGPWSKVAAGAERMWNTRVEPDTAWPAFDWAERENTEA